MGLGTCGSDRPPWAQGWHPMHLWTSEGCSAELAVRGASSLLVCGPPPGPGAQMAELSSAVEISSGNVERIQQEFFTCCRSRSPEVTLSSSGLVQHFFSLAEAEQRRIGGHPLGDPDKQVIALRAMQTIQEMDLTGNGRVGLPEWVHHCLLKQAVLPCLQAAAHIDSLLREVLKQRPGILMDLQHIFSSADPTNAGVLTFEDVVECYRQKLWHFCPSKRQGIITDDEMATRDPKALAREIVDAMDLDGTDHISYAEFMVYCLGRRRQEVTLHIYDLSKGTASAVAPWLLGMELEGVWHTGVTVFSKEYYFGGDIFFDEPAETAFGDPVKKLPMGTTLYRQDELHNFIVDELRPLFNREVYDVCTNNCNHFADTLVQWLTGRHVPAEVLLQPESLIGLPAVQALKPLLNRWVGNLEGTAKRMGDNPSKSEEDPGLDSQLKSAQRRPAPEPGTLVSIATSSGQQVLGIVCPPLAPSLASGKRGRSKSQHKEDSIWVHYLAVAYRAPSRGTKAGLRTERVPLSRIKSTRLESTQSEQLYHSALRVIAVSASPMFALMPKGSGMTMGGATRGLQPTVWQSPSSMSVAEEIVPRMLTCEDSPCTPEWTSSRKLDFQEEVSPPADSITPRKNLLGAATPLGGKEDLSVPVEARILVNFQPLHCRGSPAPRASSEKRSMGSPSPGTMVVDLHRRRRDGSPKEQEKRSVPASTARWNPRPNRCVVANL